MKKRLLSILLCFCMVISLLPMSALATVYPDGWPNDPSVLFDGDSITIDGTPYTYKGDVSSSGLNISGKETSGVANVVYDAPTTTTLYKAGNGYVIFTPATTDPAANAKLELHDAVIDTTSGRALHLPSTEPVDIIVTGDNSLTANVSYAYAIDPSGQAVNIIGDGNLTLAGSNGIYSFDGSTMSNIQIDGITINIGGTLNIQTTSNPIDSVSGDVRITAKSIAIGDAYGVFCSGAASLEATDGDITLTGGSLRAAVNGNTGVSLKASEKITVNNSAGYHALSSENGAVIVDAQGDVAFVVNSEDAIENKTGVSITSESGSITVTTSGYSCINDGSSGTVTLSAAKDITLNAENTAISASSQAVDITAGGKLTSGAKQGILAGTMTVKANQVDVTASTMDGIQASSVSITNTDGTSNCKSVNIVATSSDDSRAAIYSTGNATSGNVTVKADELFICGIGSAKAIKAAGTVTIGDAGLIAGTITAGTDNIDRRITRAAYGGDISTSGLSLDPTPPAVATYYKAGTGYVLFTPASGVTPATVTLHNAKINNTSGNALFLLNGSDTTLVVKGNNFLQSRDAAINNTGGNITIQGDGTLNAQSTPPGNGISCYAVLTITGGVSVTASSIYSIGSIIVDTTGTITAPKMTALETFTYRKGTMTGSWVSEYNGDEHNDAVHSIYGNATLTKDKSMELNSGDASLTVTARATLTIDSGVTLTIEDSMPITNNGTIVNNGTIALPDGTNAAAIKALKLTGFGVVKAGSQYYTNDGAAVTVISGGLDLTSGDHSGATLENDGYTFNNNILTLGSSYINGGLTLPANTTVNTTSVSVISGTITGDGYSALDLTFTGTAPLTINGGISGMTDGDTLTVQDGAQVTVAGSIFLGASGGANGTLNVTGTGTVLNVSAPSGYALMCDTVNVGSGASLTTIAEGTGSIGVEALTGVNVTGGSTLTAGCDYGVYISGGKLTVDDSSKLITNGSVAPFCIEAAANSTKDDALSLPGIPTGTQIASKQATNTFGIHTYWSLVPTNGNLSVSNENSTPVTLTGAITGALTFAKAASPGSGTGSTSGSGSSGGSASYTLSFEANGGSKISNISKESGTTIDFVNYKPTREGYDFAGWYSDAALTEKITSVKLTKNITLYAKWTEKPATIINPFTDVSESAYYHDAVLWAVQKSVTSGTSDTTFGSDMICTRAQMVTFLWRAMGSPKPASGKCLFTDVSQDAYYYKAVLWAVQKSITAGTSATTFGSEATVTRGQTVTFLWRAAGKPAATSANPFTDVFGDAYYYNAVLWAVEKDITHGTGATTFSPANHCTRGQVVTFLYHYIGK